MDTLKSLHENISALADGELPDSELELTLAALNDAEGRLAWQTYHLIGDVLRGAEALPGADFAARLAARLAAEDRAAEAAGLPPQSAAAAQSSLPGAPSLSAPLQPPQSPPQSPSAQAQPQAPLADAPARQAGAGGAALVAPILP